MTTKTRILAMLILGSTMVSCSQHQSVDENKSKTRQAVNFKTALYQTKGVDNTRATLEASTDGIGLYAYRGPSGFLGGASTDAATLTNYKLIYENPNWMIKDNGNNPISIFWPDLGTNDKLSFYTYFPRNAPGLSNLAPTVLGSTVVPHFDFVVNNTVANQVDLLVARWVNPVNQPANTVALAFNHATTKVGFAACTDVDNWQVTIHSVEIKNVYNSATYTYPTQVGALDQAERNATWTNYSGNASYTLPLGTTTVFDKTTNGGNFIIITSQAAGGSAFLLSQDLESNPNTPELVVTYSVRNTTTGQLIFDNVQKVFHIGNSATNSADDLATVWNRGSSVLYKYTFTKAETGVGSEVVFTVSVNGWIPMEYSLD